MLRVSVIVLSTLVSVSACGKGDDNAGSAGKGAATATAPAAPTATPLAPLGLQIDVPAGAKVEDTSADAPAVSIHADGCSLMVSTATDVYASNFEAAKKEVEKEVNPFKQFTVEKQTESGWHLEYELTDSIDKSTIVYGVKVRTTIGDKQFECGINVRNAAERDCVARACLTLRK
jgi:hypothetical protein